MSDSTPGGKKVEPNLTPILDMVFQLITFFMLVMNFKAAELDQALMLPVLGSAKPMPTGSDVKLVVLNVTIATKCPHPGCDAMAELWRSKDDAGKTKYYLHCERGHETPYPEGAITNGKTALSVFGHLLTKERRDAEHESITQYIIRERNQSLNATKPPLTEDDVVKEGKELPDTVVIRADATCPGGAVYYVISECQKQGYRKFALKTGYPTGK